MGGCMRKINQHNQKNAIDAENKIRSFVESADIYKLLTTKKVELARQIGVNFITLNKYLTKLAH
jgi:hypothetical protein